MTSLVADATHFSTVYNSTSSAVDNSRWQLNYYVINTILFMRCDQRLETSKVRRFD